MGENNPTIIFPLADLAPYIELKNKEAELKEAARNKRTLLFQRLCGWSCAHCKHTRTTPFEEIFYTTEYIEYYLDEEEDKLFAELIGRDDDIDTPICEECLTSIMKKVQPQEVRAGYKIKDKEGNFFEPMITLGELTVDTALDDEHGHTSWNPIPFKCDEHWMGVMMLDLPRWTLEPRGPHVGYNGSQLLEKHVGDRERAKINGQLLRMLEGHPELAGHIIELMTSSTYGLWTPIPNWVQSKHCYLNQLMG